MYMQLKVAKLHPSPGHMNKNVIKDNLSKSKQQNLIKSCSESIRQLPNDAWNQNVGCTDKKQTSLRKKRTVFTAADIVTLEEVYQRSKFLNPRLKRYILGRVRLSGNTVVMWFQNRRAKDRARGIII